MNTTSESISFDYSDSDRALFKNGQEKHLKEIEKFYLEIRSKCTHTLTISKSGTHKEWVTQRVEMHMITSLMRLLYLTESFRDSALKFNAVAVAVHVKAMVEIPLHLGYLVWILSSHSKFEDIRSEIIKLAWGIRDKDTGLTAKSNISQETFHTRADEMLEKHFKEEPSTIKIFRTLYKDANATGHHNFEARNVLIGVQKDEIWEIKDRKNWFIFLSSNIFQFFLEASTILAMSSIFVNVIDYYLAHLPDNFD